MDISSEKSVKKLFGEMIDECGTDEDKCREYLNRLPKSQRQMTFTFDTETVKNGFVFQFNYIVSAVKFDIHPDTQKEIDEKVSKDKQ